MGKLQKKINDKLYSLVYERCQVIIDICYQLYVEDTIVHSKEEYTELVLQLLQDSEDSK